MAIESKNLLVWVKAMSRAQALPLDASSVWSAYEGENSALNYARNNLTAYHGQIVTVAPEGEESEVFVINNPGQNAYLTKVGADNGGNTISAEKDSETGQITLTVSDGENAQQVIHIFDDNDKASIIAELLRSLPLAENASV